MSLIRLVCAPVMLLLGVSAAAALPRPAGLEPDIRFWTRVFAEIPSQQALIHDNRRLDIIYDRIAVPDSGDRAGKRRVSEQARKKYAAILRTLARGKRDGLTAEQARVLALWPADVGNDELRRAAGRVRFQQGLADGFRAGLIRSGRWEAHILDSLRAADVPEALAALPHVESSYNPAARSHVGAAGLWQFTRSTGRRFMQIDHVIDERRDPYRSSEAAAALLQYNYSILKSWPLAITAYNHGVAGMRRAVRTTGSNDIETIVRQYKGRAFGFASRNFYVAFLAAHDVAERATEYFGPLEKDLPESVAVVTLPDYVSASSLAAALDLPQRTLRRYNPALLDSIWSGLKYVPKGFALRLPADRLAAPAAGMLAAIPAERRFRRQTPDLEHKVRRGDSLSAIAARYDTTVSELMAINQLKSRHRIRAGQVLHLPYRGEPGERGSGPSAPVPPGTQTYTVRSGDTLSQIAQRSGIAERRLRALNDLTDGNRIYAGQRLRLAEEAVAVPPVAATSEPAVAAAVVDAEPAVAVAAAVADAEDDATTLQGADSAMLADPSDYLVADDRTIEIQAAETLGHYADWLNLRTQRLRDLNGYAFRQPVVIGRRLRLDLSRVTAEQFTARRLAYHRELQEVFFARYRIAATEVHEFRSGDSLFLLSLNRYKVPVWLLRQYNPDLDLDQVRPGTRVVFPKIERADGDHAPAASVADAGAATGAVVN